MTHIEKYINKKGTFICEKKWIPYLAEAIIDKKEGDILTIKLKDSTKTKIKKAIFVKIIKNNYKEEIQKLLLNALNKVYQDAFSSAGDSKCLNLKNFNKVINGTMETSKLQEKGSPFFNRRARWSVIGDKEKWESNRKRFNYAPIGIRPEDYAPLKECNKIFLELLKQVFSMKDIPFIPEEIEKELGKINKESHKCWEEY